MSPCSTSNCTPYSPQLLFPGSKQEQYLFDAFRHHVAPDLGGNLDWDFWGITLPRLANSEPPVLYAILAIAAIDQPTIMEPEQSDLRNQEISVIFYNKAITYLKTRLANEERSRHIVLLTCLLFICLEFKRGNIEVALNHLQSGLGILCAQRVPIDYSSEVSDVSEKLARAFYRLSIQGSLVGRQPPENFHRSLKGLSSSAQVTFTSLTEARESLTILFVEFLRPIHLDGNVDASDTTLDVERSRRTSFIDQLQQWNLRLGLFIIDCLPNPNRQDMRGIRFMRIQSLVASIWNSITLQSADGFPSECAFDANTTEFNNILSLVAFCIDDNDTTASTPTSAESSTSLAVCTLSPSNSSAPSPQRDTAHPLPSFSFEMGIIFALYFTAIKCRSPSIRRRAASLLSQVNPQREGIWDARVLRSISQYVADFEESCCRIAVTEDPGTWLGEEQRIHSIDIFPCCDLQRRIQRVKFVWRPVSTDCMWRDWVKDINF
jgi:hypothetical protein